MGRRWRRRSTPLAAAKLAKLRHVSDKMPGITRHKARSGFDYRLPDGELVRDNIGKRPGRMER